MHHLNPVIQAVADKPSYERFICVQGIPGAGVIRVPAWCPIVASWPRVAKRNGVFGRPCIVATMFFAQRTASRKACWAVGGCGWPVSAFGTHAQSPTVQTPGRPG